MHHCAITQAPRGTLSPRGRLGKGAFMNAKDLFKLYSQDPTLELIVFGDPEAASGPVLPLHPWQFIFIAFDAIHQKFKREPIPSDENVIQSILDSASILEQEKFEKHFFGWLALDSIWGSDPDSAWDALRNSLRPLEDIDKFTNFGAPPLERRSGKSHKALCAEPAKIMIPQDAPGREISQRPILDPSLKPHITKPKPKPRPLHPAQTVRAYILENQPYASVIKVFDEVITFCRNKHSSRGIKIYPYGQAYIALNLQLSTRHARRCWQWLRKRGIFNKRRNENPTLHHCSEWFVCTSLKQVSYFRDPERRHSHKTSSRYSNG